MENTNFILSFIKENFWIVNTLIIIFLLVMLHFFLKIFVKKLKSSSKVHFSDDIDYILKRPVSFIIYIFAIYYIFAIVFFHFDLKDYLSYLQPIRNALTVIGVMWLLLRWKKSFEKYLIRKDFKKKIDEASIDFLSKIITIVIYFVGVLVILEIFGVNIVPLIAFGGVGAAAIGFAAKDVISNFFGGLMIYVTRPYKRGDFISFPKEDVMGTVERIGWYLTSIRAIDKSPIYLPNSVFSTGQIINYSRRSHRKLETTVSVRYCDFTKINSILEEIKNHIEKIELFDKSSDKLVFFTNYNDYSLDIFIRFFVTNVSYEAFLKIQEKFLLDIHEIIKKYSADFPFPTQTINIEKE